MKNVITQPSEEKLTTAQRPVVPRPVSWWLLIGVILVFFQVVIGGITRLTDSGLSITEWAVIQGVLPPLNEAEWLEAFDKYKDAARKQFEALHSDMTLGEFKVIYFWEYFHRLWARMMGLVFVLPLAFFLWKRWIPAWLGRRLAVIFLLAASAAVFGWIMVASGLNDDSRTWVSAYKLIIHLGIASTLFGYLFWTYLRSVQPNPVDGRFQKERRFGNVLIGLLIVQILFGGLMAGMRAGLVHPHFPFFVNADGFYQALFSFSPEILGEVIDYEPSLLVKSWVQVFHRLTAYLLVGLFVIYFVRLGRLSISPALNRGRMILIFLLFLQFFLGVLTVIYSLGSIPVGFGALHQAVALLLLAALLGVRYQLVKVRAV
jgi:cytochrome c oxidase assembly protein subunit 15